MILIESVNVGKPKPIKLGRRLHTTGIYKEAEQGDVEVTPLGLRDDTIGDPRHHGGPDQALYLYSVEDYRWWSDQLGKELAFGTFGENLTLSGLDFESLRIGDRLVIGLVELEVTAPRIPCNTLATRMGDKAFVQKFLDGMRPGAYARVLSTGAVVKGLDVQYRPASRECVKLIDVYTNWTKNPKDRGHLEAGLKSPLAERARAAYERWLRALD